MIVGLQEQAYNYSQPCTEDVYLQFDIEITIGSFILILYFCN